MNNIKLLKGAFCTLHAELKADKGKLLNFNNHFHITQVSFPPPLLGIQYQDGLT